VLGGDVDTVYHDYELTLEPGGSIFVHTDGITEAKDGSGELFGSKRLLASLNGHQDGASDEIIGGVLADVEQFVGDSPQFDDITMLCLHYRGPERSKSEGEHMAVMTIDATVENIEAVTEFVNEHLEKLCCPPKAQMQIDIAIDELFSNISLYAYAPDTGPATVCVDVEENPLSVILTFIDNGKPFDPLSTDDPDVTLPAEKREIGGLGVFLVKKTMDEITYEYKNGQNILKIRKNM
jgi:sigma-B regulation protein RsbU (phosphoserine phosphatase)